MAHALKIRSFVFFYTLLFSLSSVYSTYGNEDDVLNICVIGTGYVGLVTGAGLATEHHVMCCDIDHNKIALLKQGVIPIVEPQLEELIAQVYHEASLSDLIRRSIFNGSLSFTSNISQAIQASDIVIVAVGTPMADSGEADLSAVYAVAHTIAENLNTFKVIVIKSTVPIGTNSVIQKLISSHTNQPFALASNPEFLREGSAVQDFLYPDRIVLGIDSEEAEALLKKMYASWEFKGVPVVLTSIVTAEAIKYACNAFLATKISFINEFANVCNVVGADIISLSYAMGLDKRIGPDFLKPGPGYGGSCFPKDTQALVYQAHEIGKELRIVQAAIEANDRQREIVIEQIKGAANRQLSGLTVAILGLSFKPNTDDIRYSPAIDIIQMLEDEGVFVKAYDPAGMKNMEKFFPHIMYCQSSKEAITDADIAVILTDWLEFKDLSVDTYKELMKGNYIVDTRNLYDPRLFKARGFHISNMARQ